MQETPSLNHPLQNNVNIIASYGSVLTSKIYPKILATRDMPILFQILKLIFNYYTILHTKITKTITLPKARPKKFQIRKL